MQRVVIYLKRRADLARPVCFDWWLHHHGALATQLPGLHRSIISLAADAQEGPFDGMAELWFDDLAAADTACTSVVGQAVRADTDAHVSRRERLYLTEHTIIGALKQEIATFKVPKRVFFCEQLPRNAMGKVQKNVLRAQYGAP